jgi:hypothetical protein
MTLLTRCGFDPSEAAQLNQSLHQGRGSYEQTDFSLVFQKLTIEATRKKGLQDDWIVQG